MEMNNLFTKKVIITLSMEPWISICFFPFLIIENYGILKVLILSVFKNQLTILTRLGLFKTKVATNNAKSNRKHYWIYFITLFPIKLKNLIIKLLNGLIKSIRLSLKKRSRLIKKYHMNPTVSNKETLGIQSEECTSVINESRDIYC